MGSVASHLAQGLWAKGTCITKICQTMLSTNLLDAALFAHSGVGPTSITISTMWTERSCSLPLIDAVSCNGRRWCWGRGSRGGGGRKGRRGRRRGVGGGEWRRRGIRGGERRCIGRGWRRWGQRRSKHLQTACTLTFLYPISIKFWISSDGTRYTSGAELKILRRDNMIHMILS